MFSGLGGFDIYQIGCAEVTDTSRWQHKLFLPNAKFNECSWGLSSTL